MFEFACTKDESHPPILKSGIDAVGRPVRCGTCRARAAIRPQQQPPWFLGHVVSSVCLVILLAVVIFAQAGTIIDPKNPEVIPDEVHKIAIVVVAMLMFELGRMAATSQYEGLSSHVVRPKRLLLTMGVIRLVVFFLATTIAFGLYSGSIDEDEIKVLMTLAAVTGVFEAIKTIVRLRRRKQVVHSQETSAAAQPGFFKSLWSGMSVAMTMGCIGSAFSLLGWLFDDTLKAAEKTLVNIGQEIKESVDGFDKKISDEAGKVGIENESDEHSNTESSATANQPE